MISYNNYAIKILGQDKWNELVKEFNLCTKKWTRGRTKAFYKKVDNLIKETKKSNGEDINVDKNTR